MNVPTIPSSRGEGPHGQLPAGVTLRRYEGTTLIELCDAFWEARKAGMFCFLVRFGSFSLLSTRVA
jgi:hypothetical protein